MVAHANVADADNVVRPGHSPLITTTKIQLHPEVAATFMLSVVAAK